MRLPVPEGSREIDILGFSAGSYTGLAIHEVLNDFACFPGITKVAAIASPPEMLRLATGERKVILMHCLEDSLCVLRPLSITELSYNLVMIEGHPYGAAARDIRMDISSSLTLRKAPTRSNSCKSPHNLYLRDNLLALAGHGDGHILTVTVALLLAILTGRSDLCIAGVFGTGKTRSLAVLLIALSCELDDFSAVIYTKENVESPC